MGVRGEDLLMWFREVSLARTSASQELATGWTESEAGSGQKWLGSFARYNHDASSWKTAQFSLLADSDEFLETWPRWGSMLNGESYLRPIPALPICVSASGLWPTPTCDSGTERSKRYAQGGTPLTLAVKSWPTPCARDYRGIGRSRLERTGSTAGENPPHIVGGLLNPTWVEWLMGWPIGWTELKPLETDKFREWQQQHSICSHEVKNAA
jgi:hypothetical protein